METQSKKTTPFWIGVQEKLLASSGIQMISDHYVWINDLTKQCTVLDLGANVRSFSSEISRLFGCQCVAVEPDLQNYSQIQECDLIRKVQSAVGATDGTGMLFLSDNVESHSLFPMNDGVTSEFDAVSAVPIEVLSFQSLLAKAGVTNVKLMKLDIEGAEWDFLSSLTDEEACKIQQITVEFHDFVPSMRQWSRTTQICQRLSGLGFICVQDIRRGSYNTLFLNTKQRQLSARTRTLLSGVLFVGKIRQWINGGRRRLGLPHST